ncbi:hypothetical protein SAMN05444746_13628 [Variovorax sp. OK212]|nr:hypothetical protein SAMN05518853_13728 [Variovorax sp. OK202]SFE75126.1 hypothetical protein SAMN05444746_13628 [Variovorax sp. OK212]
MAHGVFTVTNGLVIQTDIHIKRVDVRHDVVDRTTNCEQAFGECMATA